MYKILRKHPKDTAEFKEGNTVGKHFLDRVWRVGSTLWGGGSGEESPAQPEWGEHTCLWLEQRQDQQAEGGGSDRSGQVTSTENLHDYSST